MWDLLRPRPTFRSFIQSCIVRRTLEGMSNACDARSALSRPVHISSILVSIVLSPMSAFSSSGGRSLVFSRTPSFDSVSVSDVEEMTTSANSGGR